MIISNDDLTEVHRLLENVAAYRRLTYDEADEVATPQDPVVLGERPHLLMALGFDEFKTFDLSNFDNEDHWKDHWSAIEQYGIAPYHPAFERESLFRDGASGAWYWYEGIGEDTLHFVGPPQDRHRHFPINAWLKTLELMNKKPDSKSRVLWLPGLWTPKIQGPQRIALGSAAEGLVQAIHNEERELNSIPWRQLEELVAELLRSRGLEVFLTPRSGDGGRDIIARGELIPGEPTVLAVEVKQKPVVGLADVQRALRANEDFPVLMMATAGRFSAGVISERNRSRNQMRLFLKDGIALTQWIESYVSSQAVKPNSSFHRTCAKSRVGR